MDGSVPSLISRSRQYSKSFSIYAGQLTPLLVERARRGFMSDLQ